MSDPITYIESIEVDMPGEAKLIQFIAMRSDHKVIGTATLANPDKIIPEIQRLFVPEDSRRNGIATALIDRCCDWCRRLDKKAISLYINKNNGAAMAFYIATGFEMAFQFQDGDIVLSKKLK